MARHAGRRQIGGAARPADRHRSVETARRRGAWSRGMRSQVSTRWRPRVILLTKAITSCGSICAAPSLRARPPPAVTTPGEPRTWRRRCTRFRQSLRSAASSLVGHSLGGNLVLKFMGEGGYGLPVLAAAAISTPLDLAGTCARMMERRNLPYHRHMLRAMKDGGAGRERVADERGAGDHRLSAQRL